MRSYEREWYNKLKADKNVRAVCKDIASDDTGDVDQLAQQLAHMLCKLSAKKRKSLKRLTKAVKRNTEMTDEEALEIACGQVDQLTEELTQFKDTEDFMAANMTLPYEVGYSPTGDGTISVDIYMVPEGEKEAIWNLIYDWGENKGCIMIHCISPRDTKQYYNSYYKES